MTKSDFALLDNFSAAEVRKANGKPASMKFQTLWRLQVVRTGIGRRIKFCKNGLNSGKHKSPEHPNGQAVDCYLDPRDGPVTFYAVLYMINLALDAGFRGVGIYWNGTMYSFHFDIGRRRGWTAVRKVGYIKAKRYKYWEYHRLYVDPRTFKKAA